MVAFLIWLSMAFAAEDVKAKHLAAQREIVSLMAGGQGELATEKAVALVDHTLEAHPDNDALVSGTLNLAGVTFATVGHNQDALEWFLRGLQVELKAGVDGSELAMSYLNIGGCLARLEDYGPARVAMERAVALQTDEEGVLRSEFSLAMLDVETGDYDRAIDRMNGLLPRARKAGQQSELEANILRHLGLAHLMRGEFDVARSALGDSVTLFSALHGRESVEVAGVLTIQSDLASDLGAYETASELQTEVVRIFEEQQGPNSAMLAAPLNNLAVLHTSAGKHELALEYYGRSAELTRLHAGPDSVTLAGIYANMARRYTALGDLGSAADYIGKGLVIVEALDDHSPYEPTVLAAASDVARAGGRHEEALRYRQRALEAAQRSDSPLDVVDHRTNIAFLLGATGRFDEARVEASQAVAEYASIGAELLPSMSDRERLGFIWAFRSSLHAYLTVTAGTEQGPAVYDAVLAWKGVAGAALEATRLAAHESAADPEIRDLVDRLEEVSSAVSVRTLDPGLEAAERQQAIVALLHDKDEIQRDLARKTRDLQASRNGAEVTTERLCEVLGPDEVLVDFVVHSVMNLEDFSDSYRYLAFVLRPGECSVIRVELGDAGAIEEAIDGYLDRMSNAGNPERVDRAGGAVREAIWDPISEHIGAATRVYVVPDGQTARVSFAALPRANAGYLVEHLQFGYLDRAGVLLREPHGDEGSGAVVVGGLDYGEAGPKDGPCLPPAFGPLPASLGEAKMVQRYLSKRLKAPAYLLSAGAAEESVLRVAIEQAPQFLHLATHGFFLERDCAGGVQGGYARNPMAYSGLALAGANEGSEGLWTAEEVAALDLVGTQLVVLSACDTGRGHTMGGEGALGLRRAFAAAGADTVIMSLWSIEDEATRDLMSKLYAAMMHRGDPSPIDALRAAQLETLANNRKRYGHGLPSTWGAFIGSGRWP